GTPKPADEGVGSWFRPGRRAAGGRSGRMGPGPLRLAAREPTPPPRSRPAGLADGGATVRSRRLLLRGGAPGTVSVGARGGRRIAKQGTGGGGCGGRPDRSGSPEVARGPL
ncbi:MAG: hypothetical protein AVDCRST_MAG19-4397, partial [uncultured Thermomicrobiales bacterium]